MTKKSYFLLRPSVALAKEGSRFFIPISYLIFLISYFLFLISYLLFLPSPVFSSFPTSTNYRLDEWAIGGGGSEQGQSTNYQMETITDPTVGDPAQSINYSINPGLLFVQMANVPPAPSLTNPADYYNKLNLILDTGDNPAHTTFAVAISPDNFVTTYYVKADNRLGTTLTASDWRTYASWGGATGIDILGLSASTTYSVRVKAERGDFTESGWGPIASETTSDPSLVFDIDVAATDTDTAPPYLVAFGDLSSTGTVITATDKIWTDFATNADSGGTVYITGTANGLQSQSAAHIIAGVSGDLSAQSEGFGINTASITQSAGGPFTADSPFSNSGSTVGATGTTLIPLATSLAPLTAGRHQIDVKTIINQLTPAATDYTETLTIVAAATF
jgi:hypothetical protein